jgi:UDP-N-acetylglucosamine 4,6-dehydratase
MTFDKSTLLLTGGTGSFGKQFVNYLLKNHNLKKIIIFSRDEMKQWVMAEELKEHSNLVFMIGDVRDRDRLNYCMRDVDFVVHAAATKIVPTAEYNPFECIKTNINGAVNVVRSALENKVQKVVALSTDKASNPINLYGATKLASDKLFIAANSNDKNKTIFSVVRYGNVMGSRGSVIPFFINFVKTNDYFPITDERMTRFMISLDDAVNLVITAFNDMKGGELYVKKIPSMKVTDIAKAINPDLEHKIIGIRPGEKIHEQMIGFEDSEQTFEYREYYKILPMIHNWYKDLERIKDGKKVNNDFIYSSDRNKDWMTVSALNNWIKKNYDQFLKI